MDATAVTVERHAIYECALCRVAATATDRNGMSYCDVHWRVAHPQRLRRLVGSLRRVSYTSGAGHQFGAPRARP